MLAQVVPESSDVLDGQPLLSCNLFFKYLCPGPNREFQTALGTHQAFMQYLGHQRCTQVVDEFNGWGPSYMDHASTSMDAGNSTSRVAKAPLQTPSPTRERPTSSVAPVQSRSQPLGSPLIPRIRLFIMLYVETLLFHVPPPPVNSYESEYRIESSSALHAVLF